MWLVKKKFCIKTTISFMKSEVELWKNIDPGIKLNINAVSIDLLSMLCFMTVKLRQVFDNINLRKFCRPLDYVYVKFGYVSAYMVECECRYYKFRSVSENYFCHTSFTVNSDVWSIWGCFCYDIYICILLRHGDPLTRFFCSCSNKRLKGWSIFCRRSHASKVGCWRYFLELLLWW